MSSDSFVFDGSSSSSIIFHSSSPDEADFLFADHEFSPFSDSSIDILQALKDHQTQSPQNPEPSYNTDHQIISLPSQELQNLTLYNNNQRVLSDFTLGDHYSFRIKTEQSKSGFEHLLFGDGCVESEATKLMKRSSSSNSFEQKPCSSSSSFSYSPRFDALIEPQIFQSQALSKQSNP